ncbi:Beta-galactosidase C-terminal domain [Streptomyces sp. NPDC059567]
MLLAHHGREETAVTVPGHHHDLLTGATVEGALRLGRHGAAVLKEAP